MAYPVIQFDSATGDDTNASGAGPSTAITSTSGSTDSGGTVVTIPSADLSNVLVDGSHAVYISGHGLRKITAKADSGLSTANVTVGTAFTGSLSSQTVAIGGKRETIFGSTQSEVQSSLEPGWTVEFAAGHSESVGVVSFQCADSRGNAITLRGDASNPATFVSVYNGFTIHFQFGLAAGACFENMNFEAYRGTDTSGTGAVQAVLQLANRQVLRNCKATCPNMYDANPLFDGGTSGNQAYINCTAELTLASAQYTKGTGFSGRGVQVINCTVSKTKNGVSSQAYGSHVSLVRNSQFDVDTAYSVNINYHHGHVFVGNIAKLQNGGKLLRLASSNWQYDNNGRILNIGNVVTSAGTYEIYDLDSSIAASEFNKNVYDIDNCYHNSSRTETPAIPSDQDINTITTDPQLTGNVGSFAVGSQAVVDHVGVAAGVTSGGGANVHPLRSN